MQLESSLDKDFTGDSAYLGRILVVDDDPAVLRSLRKTLEFTHPDYLIECAESAEDALDLLRQDEVDLLISDLKLPRIDGLRLVALAREERPRMRSILMTAYGSDSVLSEAADNGCIAYLEKPFDLELLIHSINTALSATGVDNGPNLAAIEVFELFAKSGVDTILNVCTRTSAGLVAMEHGFIRHAEFEGVEGLEALMRIMRHPSVSITPMRPGRGPRQTLNLSAGSLRAILGMKPQATRAGGRWSNRSTERSLAQQAVQETPLEAGSDSVYQPGLERKRKAMIDQLINAGLEHLRASRHQAARRCWLEALEIDPYSAEAARNLAALEKVLKRSRKDG